jgi:hypothetical protein
MGFFVGLLIFIVVLEFYFNERELRDADGKGTGLYCYVDPATGVHYIKDNPLEQLRIRINADGTPYTGRNHKTTEDH